VCPPHLLCRERHARQNVYTAIGPIVLALNPFAAVNECTPEHLSVLASKKDADGLPPHAFNLARSAYTVMARTGGAQSILVSGESGAGKTETAKICMRCLANLSGSSEKATALTLESGLLLEAFGNAKTVHNHNSSRFGKWVAVHFSASHGTISSCEIRPYLLEVSRVVSQAASERNYHIFYQMLAACSARGDSTLGLEAGELMTADRYEYTKVCTAVEQIDDTKEWRMTLSALARLGLESETSQICCVLLGVLRLGNITFTSSSAAGEENSAEPAKVDGATAAATMLGVDADALTQALVWRYVYSGRGSMYRKALSPQQCADARDALAKGIYVRLFEWLVAKLNESMAEGMAEEGQGQGQQKGGGRGSVSLMRDSSASFAISDSESGADDGEEEEFVPRSVPGGELSSISLGGGATSAPGIAPSTAEAEGGAGGRFIGLLDIFGFENFTHNSLEQLCINFANEKLQSTFIGALVATQRAEYIAEGISCGAIAFPENAEQLSLLDGRLGILALLDEECALPKGSEEAYVEKMHSRFSKLPSYAKPHHSRTKGGGGGGGKRGGGGVDASVASTRFVVRHYAGEVIYTASGWLDKNRGHLPTQLLTLFTASAKPLVSGVFKPDTDAALDGGGGVSARASAGDGNRGSRGSGRASTADGGGRSQKQKAASTVAGRFRASLRELFDVLQGTSSRFVRCIKPNPEKLPGRFDGSYVERQLLCNGVLAIVEVQAAGYSLSLKKAEFLARYSCCASLTNDEAAAVTAALGIRGGGVNPACATLLSAAERTIEAAEGGAGSVNSGGGWLVAGDVALGHTKVFLREGVVRLLEKARDAVASVAALALQRRARVWLARRVVAKTTALKALARQVRSATTASDARAALQEL
jgi:myosin heavy subunit